MEPPPRFGASLLPITRGNVKNTDYKHINQYILTGGSNGSDLFRNGEEILDVSDLNRLYSCSLV